MNSIHFPGSYSFTKEVEIKVGVNYVSSEKLDDEIKERIGLEKNIFVYQVEITNHRKGWIRLLTRNWQVIDSEGEEVVVSGKGVVGETPKLNPDEKFVYSSFCPLASEWGTMEGSYGVEDEDGNRFQVKINRFYLINPENQAVKYSGSHYESK